MSTPVRRAIYGRLAGDTTLNALLGTPAPGRAKAIYHNAAPAGATFPYVLLSKQSGVPTGTMGDAEALKDDIWMVKAVDHSPTADPAEAADARVQTLLNDATLSISGVNHLFLRRQSDVEYEEDTGGERYQHVGGLYRLVHD